MASGDQLSDRQLGLFAPGQGPGILEGHVAGQAEHAEEVAQVLLGGEDPAAEVVDDWLSGDIAFQDAGTLSGGEKTKLALAQLVAGKHNLLLLDEPTNNLDPPSRDAIGSALSGWPGAMIIVSHDAGFVSQLAPSRVLMMPDGVEDHWSDDLLDLVALA